MGRWVLVGAILAGWAIGTLGTLPHMALTLITAFLGGGIILNTLKEEVPGEHEGRIVAFVLGAGAYAIVLVTLV